MGRWLQDPLLKPRHLCGPGVKAPDGGQSQGRGMGSVDGLVETSLLPESGNGVWGEAGRWSQGWGCLRRDPQAA